MLYKNYIIIYKLNSESLFIRVTNNNTNLSYECELHQHNITYKLTNIYNIFKSLESRLKIQLLENKHELLDSVINIDFNLIENKLCLICSYNNELMQIEYELELKQIENKPSKNIEIKLLNEEFAELKALRIETVQQQELIIELEDKIIELGELLESNKITYKDKLDDLTRVISKKDIFIDKLLKENEHDEDIINENNLIIAKQSKLIHDSLYKLAQFEHKKIKNKKHTVTIKNELSQLDFDDE